MTIKSLSQQHPFELVIECTDETAPCLSGLKNSFHILDLTLLLPNCKQLPFKNWPPHLLQLNLINMRSLQTLDCLDSKYLNHLEILYLPFEQRNFRDIIYVYNEVKELEDKYNKSRIFKYLKEEDIDYFETEWIIPKLPKLQTIYFPLELDNIHNFTFPDFGSVNDLASIIKRHDMFKHYEVRNIIYEFNCIKIIVE